ncbi:MAG: hypothetical protein WB729_03615 [Candidatus Sulfotelmatobacter sp.]
MKPLFLICITTIFLAPIFMATTFVRAQVPAPSQSAAQSSPSAQTSASISVDQANARKAKTLLQQAIDALGGQAYLTLRNVQQSGRGYSFHHGRPTSNGVLYWRFAEFPDKERVEVTKERDIAELYIGDKGYEITYKGAHPMEAKDLTDYIRRRRFSLETILRSWVNDPGVALFYDGDAIAAQHPSVQITLINSKDESVDLFLDVDTHLPIKKSFQWRDPVDRQKNLEEEIYDNYRQVQGIATPYDVSRYFNGDMAGQRFLNSVSYNETFDPAMFDPNSGYNPNKTAKKR